MILPTVPQHLVGKGLTSIDYGIGLARETQSIGQQLVCADFALDPFLDEIGKTFMQIIGDLGIKTLPDKASEKRIVHYMTNYYKDFTIDEIKKAFELALVGELDVEIEHYNSFDLKYICKILNKYRARRSKALHAIARATPKEQVEMTQEQKEEIRLSFLETVCKAYERFVDGEPFEMFAPHYVYDTLDEMGVISYGKSKKLKIYRRAKRKYVVQLSRPKGRKEKNLFQSILDNFQSKDNADAIKRIAKEIALMDFLNFCKAKKIDLRQKLSIVNQKQSKNTSKQSKTS